MNVAKSGNIALGGSSSTTCLLLHHTGRAKVEILTAWDVTDARRNWIVRCCQGRLRYIQLCSAATITAVVLSYAHNAVIPPLLKIGRERCQREMIIEALLLLLLVMNPGPEDPWDVYKILAIYSSR